MTTPRATKAFPVLAALSIGLGAMLIGAAPAGASPYALTTCDKETRSITTSNGAVITYHYRHSDGKANFYQVTIDGNLPRPEDPGHRDNWASCGE